MQMPNEATYTKCNENCLEINKQILNYNDWFEIFKTAL